MWNDEEFMSEGRANRFTRTNKITSKPLIGSRSEKDRVKRGAREETVSKESNRPLTRINEDRRRAFEQAITNVRNRYGIGKQGFTF